MSSRVIDLCLLAYPRTARRRDGDYLRDLAGDLAERQGLGRQAVSLLLGGLRERVLHTRKLTWRFGVVSVAVLALMSAVTAVGAVAEAGRQAEGFACEANSVAVGRGCAAAAQRMMAVQERAGWHCTPHGRLAVARGVATWECTRQN